MVTRRTREGIVGLFIIIGLSLTGALALYIRGVSLGNRGYHITVSFPHATNLQVGSFVRFRGVEVGKVKRIRAGTNGIEVEALIASESLRIPRQSLIQIQQEGLIGTSFLDILPQAPLTTQDLAKPKSSDCDPSQIFCNGARLDGEPGATLDKLLRVSIQVAEQLQDPGLFEDIKAIAKNSSQATAEFGELTRQVLVLTRTLDQELEGISDAAIATTDTANQTLVKLGRVAEQLETVAIQVNTTITENQPTITETLANVRDASLTLKTSMASLSPLLDRVQGGQLIDNLETLSNNAAQASANLNTLSASLGNPENILLLEQTLDSARATFQNAQKITTDLDELTGDPAFRTNIRRLIDGLSDLVSATEQLQQQTQEIATLKSSSPPTP